MRLTRATVERAIELGHQVELEHRPAPADHPEWNAKWWAVCSCGYRSTARLSEKAGVQVVLWHLGKAVGETDGVRSLNGAGRVPGVSRSRVAEG